ncbi:TetR family transcriptional regulator [Streptomyces sp. NPDC059096]|uniref:TetR family transcriptional regulator n=1 Tax=unclassified Streptomyces TaxID=2593676 RepID=UPI0036C326C9
MNAGPRTTTRDIARAAVRSELAQVAYDLIRREGFDRVTVSDLAAAAGVSRSTFLRYFDTKEDAVIGAVEAQGEQLATALRERPAEEDDWTALRRALGALVEPFLRDPAEALATTRLIMGTPALCNRRREKQHGWRPLLVGALAGRTDPPRPEELALAVKAGAALECLDIALDHWLASDGRLDLVHLLDETFAALTPADG